MRDVGSHPAVEQKWLLLWESATGALLRYDPEDPGRSHAISALSAWNVRLLMIYDIPFEPCLWWSVSHPKLWYYCCLQQSLAIKVDFFKGTQPQSPTTHVHMQHRWCGVIFNTHAIMFVFIFSMGWLKVLSLPWGFIQELGCWCRTAWVWLISVKNLLPGWACDLQTAHWALLWVIL